MKLNVPSYSQYLEIPHDTMKAVRACGMTCVKMILDYRKSFVNKNKDGKRSNVNDIGCIQTFGKEYYLEEMYDIGIAEGGTNENNDWLLDYLASYLNIELSKNSKYNCSVNENIENQILEDNNAEVDSEIILYKRKSRCGESFINNQLRKSIDAGYPVIVSVVREMFGVMNSSHLILITGYRISAENSENKIEEINDKESSNVESATENQKIEALIYNDSGKTKVGLGISKDLEVSITDFLKSWRSVAVYAE